MTNELTHSQADIVRELLVDASPTVLTEPDDDLAWPGFAFNEPSNPDNCVTIYSTEGTSDGRSMIDGELQVHRGFQVRVRSKNPKTGYAKASSISQYMAKSVYQKTVVVDSSTYLVQAITKIGDILSLGTDAPKTKRSLFTINATISVKQVS